MRDRPLFDMDPKHLTMVQEILRRRVPDREVWVFGSRARWTAKKHSDLDLAILGEEPLSLGVLADLRDDFSASDLPFKVDVVEWATTSESFRRIIERGRVVVSCQS
ncbi:MAG: nucleotidyltransferase domain-containing protein [Magnetococcales bacterium]|nr:nucleotidyltransferase domain-containing protein [Magnetococcales bacterium]